MPVESGPVSAPRHAGRATAMIVFSACCFGSIPVIITLATRTGAGLTDLLAWRYLIAAALLVVVGGGPAPLRQPARRAAVLLVLAGGGQAAVAVLSLSALAYIPAATLTFLFYSYPAWLAIISAVRGTERLTARRGCALLVSLAGLALMVGMPGTGGLSPVGVLLALSSAFVYALYIPTLDFLGRGLAPAVTAAYAAGGAAVILTAMAIWHGGLALHFAPAGWLAVLLLAVLCTVLAFLAFLRGLASLGPVRTAIVSTIEPFWAALLGSVVLRQHLGARTLAGGLLIAAAVVILQLGQRSLVPASSA